MGVLLAAGLLCPLLAPRAQEAKPSAATQEASEDEPAKPTKAHTGAELFKSSGCSHCHRIAGEGGVIGPDLSGIGRHWKDAQIRQRSLAGTLTMPPYADVLSEPDLGALVAYLHKQRARAAKPVR